MEKRKIESKLTAKRVEEGDVSVKNHDEGGERRTQ
jgi:hypothetical protein